MHDNILVECDGIQHKESIEYFGGDERLEYQQNNDNIKTKWSLDKGIKLYRLTSIDEIDDFVDMLSKIELVFDKSILKDLSLDRSDKIKNDINYLVKILTVVITKDAIATKIDADPVTLEELIFALFASI